MIRERVTDPAELETYGQLARSARAGHDITPVAAYGAVDVVEGPSIEGVLINRFPTMDEAHRWYRSPAYQAALGHRLRGADYRVLIVEGVEPAAPSEQPTP